jgi:hypothetical protein
MRRLSLSFPSADGTAYKDAVAYVTQLLRKNQLTGLVKSTKTTKSNVVFELVFSFSCCILFSTNMFCVVLTGLQLETEYSFSTVSVFVKSCVISLRFAGPALLAGKGAYRKWAPLPVHSLYHLYA